MNNNSIMMSDELVGNIPELENDVSSLSNKFVLTSICLDDGTELTGVVTTVLFGTKTVSETELEFKTQLPEAIKLLDKMPLISSVTLVFDSTIITREGPFCINAARILNIDPNNQLCVLALSLHKNNHI